MEHLACSWVEWLNIAKCQVCANWSIKWYSPNPSPKGILWKLTGLALKFFWTMCLKIAKAGFPGGAVVENLPANAGHAGSSPGLGRSHVPRSGWAHEPQLLSLRVWSLCSATGEASIVRGPCTAMRSGPRLPRLGKALTQKRRPNTAINKKKKK